MSGVFWIGLVLIIIGLIVGIIEYFITKDAIMGCIILIIAIPCFIIGCIDTSIALNKAKPGYILENSKEKQIEVLNTRDNFIQFVEEGDTLVVNRNNWINDYSIGMRIVNIKNF